MKVTAAGSLGLMAFHPFGCSGRKAPDRKSYGVGLQLYTVRDAMAEDVPGTLKKVADLGYKYPEPADYADGKFYGYAPAELRQMAEDLGMEVVSTHTKVEAQGVTLDNARKMADAHAELGAKYCIQPWVEEEDRNVESYKRMVADWNEVGRIMKDAGIQFGYHNHNFEFDNLDGIVPYYDIYMKEMDPELITMEIDLFWVSKAGQDPVEMFKRYPGRFQMFHLKDMMHQEEPFFDVHKEDICAVGEGVIDFKRILAARETAGMKYFFVEDDNQGNGHPFEAIETSIVNLTTDILV
jgi:sugar phosphate isomerase/epimerase